MSDRIDDLLDQALVTGVIPEEATAEERAELEGLLAAMRGVKETGLAIRAEAQETMPSARARFERFTAAQQQARHLQRPASGGRGRWFSRFPGGRGLSFAGVAAAAAAIVVGALILPGSFGGVESASAQVLTEGSYVQVEGVVTNRTTADGQVSLVVQSDLGEIAVDLADGTSVLDDQGAIRPGDVQSGRQVVVSGVVGKAHRVQAQTVTLGQEAPPPPVPPRVEQLKDLPQRLEGEVRTISLSPDGKRARIHIVTAAGGHFWAVVEAPGVQALLERSANALGTMVRLVHPPGTPPGVFIVEPVVPEADGPSAPVAPTPTPETTRPPAGPSPSPTPSGAGSGGETARPGLVTVRGIVLSRDGALVTVETDRRVVTVRVTQRTVILVGPDGVTLDARSGDRAIGHAVSVTGLLNEQTQQLLADVIVLGPKPVTGD
jgi:hypothetical protein